MDFASSTATSRSSMNSHFSRRWRRFRSLALSLQLVFTCCLLIASASAIRSPQSIGSFVSSPRIKNNLREISVRNLAFGLRGGSDVLEEGHTSDDGDETRHIGLGELSDEEAAAEKSEGTAEGGDEAAAPASIENEESDEEDDSEENDTSALTAEAMPAVVETTVLHHVDTAETVAEDSESSDENDAESEDLSSGEESADAEEEEDEKEGETVDTLMADEVEAAIGIAHGIRGEGKELHDDGSFTEAAARFSSAANLLLPLLGTAVSGETVADDFATCRLHEALCLLKADDFEEALRACTDVLDGPSISNSESFQVAPALRARAFHRRAKAQMELGNEAAALEDAREAAFLGDQKAVAFYGKLLRENSGNPWPSELGTGATGGAGGFGDLASSSALFESLLNKSNGPSSDVTKSPMGDMGGISSLLGMMGAGSPSLGGIDKGGEGVGSLAKSVLGSLTKRLEDESTQEQICKFLQGTSGPQLQQMAGLAGLQVEEGQANRLAGFCQGVTPKLIKRTLGITKTCYYVFSLVRKVFKFVSKYRTILILLLIVGWTKSAILRPLPINKKAARLAAKAAAAEAEKITAKVNEVVASM